MSRPPPDGYGRQACASVDLVVPLGHEPTAMRITDTAAAVLDRSGAVSPPNRSDDDRPGDVTSTTRSTPATRVTPGTRTSTTATRTTTTRTTSSAPAPSADQPALEDLVRAYLDCRATKRNTASALAFEIGLEDNLRALHADLIEGHYRIGPSICFVITRPKPREVWAAQLECAAARDPAAGRGGEDRRQAPAVGPVSACPTRSLYRRTQSRRHARGALARPAAHLCELARAGRPAADGRAGSARPFIAGGEASLCSPGTGAPAARGRHIAQAGGNAGEKPPRPGGEETRN